MQTEIERESLMKAFNKLRINSLPEKKEENDKKIWAIAIALLEKVDLTRNYAIVTNDGFGNPMIKEDFGKSAQVVKISKLTPVFYLDENTMPMMRKQSDIVKYLRMRDYNEKKIEELLTSKGKTEKKVEKDRALVQSYIVKCAVDDMFENINL